MRTSPSAFLPSPTGRPRYACGLRVDVFFRSTECQKMQHEYASFGQEALPDQQMFLHQQQYSQIPPSAIYTQQPQVSPFMPPSAYLPTSSSSSSATLSSIPAQYHVGTMSGAPYPSLPSSIAQPYPQNHSDNRTSIALPYVPPELDFGDWSSPLAAPATFPHEAASTVPIAPGSVPTPASASDITEADSAIATLQVCGPPRASFRLV